MSNASNFGAAKVAKKRVQNTRKVTNKCLLQPCGMVQLFEVTLPDGFQTLDVFRQGMIRNDQDIVTGDITFLYAQFPKIILVGFVFPGVTDIFTSCLFQYGSRSDFVVAPYLSPCES